MTNHLRPTKRIRRTAGIRKLASGLTGALVAGLVAGCAVLPDWHYRESRETCVLVDYEVDADSTDPFVVLPASNAWLKVLRLRTRPDNVRESFAKGQRRMHLPPNAHHLRVLCRYKIYRRRDAVGRPLPWPTPAELFPGAAQIRPGRPGAGDDALYQD